MLEIVIINNDFSFVSNIINNIFINSNIKIIGLFDNANESLDFISKYHPDIVILSSDEFPSLKKIIDNSYHPNIILLTNSLRSRNFSHILYLSTCTSYKTMKRTILSFINSKNIYKITLKIESIISKFNFDFSLNGTRYLVESIVYSYLNKSSYVCENLEKKVYNQIAKKHNSTVYNIKWSIVRSINNMYFNNTTSSMKKVNSYFNLDPLEKPTAKLIISTIVNNI